MILYCNSIRNKFAAQNYSLFNMVEILALNETLLNFLKQCTPSIILDIIPLSSVNERI